MQHTIIIEAKDVVVTGETLEENERLGLRDSEELSKYVQHPRMSSVSGA